MDGPERKVVAILRNSTNDGAVAGLRAVIGGEMAPGGVGVES